MSSSSFSVNDSPLSKRIASSLARLRKLDVEMKKVGSKKQSLIWRRMRRIVDRTDKFVARVSGASWHKKTGR